MSSNETDDAVGSTRGPLCSAQLHSTTQLPPLLYQGVLKLNVEAMILCARLVTSFIPMLLNSE